MFFQRLIINLRPKLSIFYPPAIYLQSMLQCHLILQRGLQSLLREIYHWGDVCYVTFRWKVLALSYQLYKSLFMSLKDGKDESKTEKKWRLSIFLKILLVILATLLKVGSWQSMTQGIQQFEWIMLALPWSIPNLEPPKHHWKERGRETAVLKTLS